MSISRLVMHTGTGCLRWTQLYCFIDASQNAFAACMFDVQTIRYQLFYYMLKLGLPPLNRAPFRGSNWLGYYWELSYVQRFVSLSGAYVENIFFGNDFTIVLAWIKNTNPSNLKQFVHNRVNEIHELTDKSSWRHVITEMNPADMASRGASPGQLLTSIMFIRVIMCIHRSILLNQNESDWSSIAIQNRARTQSAYLYYVYRIILLSWFIEWSQL